MQIFPFYHPVQLSTRFIFKRKINNSAEQQQHVLFFFTALPSSPFFSRALVGSRCFRYKLRPHSQALFFWCRLQRLKLQHVRAQGIHICIFFQFFYGGKCRLRGLLFRGVCLQEKEVRTEIRHVTAMIHWHLCSTMTHMHLGCY